MNRRTALKLGAAAPALSARRLRGANDRIRIGLIGTGGRCVRILVPALKTLPGHEIVAACDVYEPRRLKALAELGPSAEGFNDYRRLLDRKDIDAVLVTSPDHWHAPMTMDAVAAGKDVYVEKPVTHELSEGDKLIAAVEKSGRVVATGTQQRSWPHYLQARDIVASGALGRITFVQAYWYQNYAGGGGKIGPGAVESGKLDWAKWLGPARPQPFEANRFLRWRFFWDFGGGVFGDLMTHWIDVIQWYMNSPLPKSVQAYGATHAATWLETPDTVTASIEFPQNYSVVYYGSMIGTLEGGGIVFRGTKGMMKLTRDGLLVYREGLVPAERTFLPNPDVTVQETREGWIRGTDANLRNWLECIRSRKEPNAHIRGGVEAARTAHLANLAMRKKRILTAEAGFSTA